jgi:predicted metal-binding membrane protein
VSTLRAHRGLLGASAVVFAASAITTVLWCGSMASVSGMEMPGGWRMSMAWMRMPGQSWPGAAATFIGMWSVMMVAMMLPVLVPVLTRYREALARTPGTRFGQLTTLVGAGYFAVWTLCGAIVFPVGLALSETAMRVPAVSRAMPIATGVVMLIAGILQFTAWKKRRLACCRAAPRHEVTAGAGAAWCHGLQLGVRCVHCCASMTAVLLAIGVMDLRAMAAVTALISAERLAPAGERVARGIGMVVVASGLIQVAKATGLC